jgi:hypothetical protein
MARTSPFFIPKKEVNLIDTLNEELIDEIIGQSVDIYKVSVDETEANMYGESTHKYFESAFRVNCLIQFNEPETEMMEGVGSDTNQSIEMYFQRNNLSSGSLNFFPEIGDVVDWNEVYWEINSVTEPQLIGGHPGFNHQIKANAHRARMSSLQIEERPR